MVGKGRTPRFAPLRRPSEARKRPWKDPSTQCPVASWGETSFRREAAGRQGRIGIPFEDEYSSRIGLADRRLQRDIGSSVVGSVLSQRGELTNRPRRMGEGSTTGSGMRTGRLTTCDRGAMVSQLVALLVCGGGFHDGGLRIRSCGHIFDHREHSSRERDEGTKAQGRGRINRRRGWARREGKIVGDGAAPQKTVWKDGTTLEESR